MLAPEQSTALVVAIETLGTRLGETVMLMADDVTLVGVAPTALLVKVQLTELALAKVLVVKVAALVPAFDPFTFH